VRSIVIVSLAAIGLAACADPVAQQARVDTRHDAVRSDSLVLVNFAQGAGQLSAVQVKEIRDIVASGRRANRDEFLVVSDGSGGALQEMDARRVGQTLSEAGARWVNTAVEPTMATGPNSVLCVEYPIQKEDGTSGTAERMIPFVSVYVDTVDIAGKCITVDWQPDY